MCKERLIKELDRVFSLAVRLKYADEFKFVKCATCDANYHYSQMTCAHNRKRRHLSTRWLMKNCGVQCTFCNGADRSIEEFLQAEYGIDVIDELLILSHKEFHPTAEWLKQKTKEFSLML